MLKAIPVVLIYMIKEYSFIIPRTDLLLMDNMDFLNVRYNINLLKLAIHKGIFLSSN